MMKLSARRKDAHDAKSWGDVDLVADLRLVTDDSIKCKHRWPRRLGWTSLRRLATRIVALLVCMAAVGSLAEYLTNIGYTSASGRWDRGNSQPEITHLCDKQKPIDHMSREMEDGKVK